MRGEGLPTTASENAVSVSSVGRAASGTGVSGEQPAAVPQRRGDRDAGPGRQGDQAVRSRGG